MYFEELNYARDPRVRARDGRVGMGPVDERTMTAPVILPDEDTGDHALAGHVPVRYEVCDLCDGRGRHVNPSVDASGLSGEDFDRDPDFREDYFAGRYDVTCYACDGARVCPVPAPRTDADRALVARLSDYQAGEAAYARESAMERAMGA